VCVRVAGEASSSPQDRDVMIITDLPSFSEESWSPSGEGRRPASGMVRALRQAGFPVTVVSPGDARAVCFACVCVYLCVCLYIPMCVFVYIYVCLFSGQCND
jgi:hypothetical protein